MARAYICLVRNDLEDNFLQVLDLMPSLPGRNGVYDPQAQAEILTFFVRDDLIGPTHATIAGDQLDESTYGLAAYLLDRVENTGGGNLALTPAQAEEMSNLLLGRVADGLPLTEADVNASVINATTGVSGSDLTGVLGGSRGQLTDILQILVGTIFKLPEGCLINAAGGGMPLLVNGFFVSRPNLVPARLTGPGGFKRPFSNQRVPNIASRPIGNGRICIVLPPIGPPRPRPRPIGGIRKCWPVPPPPPSPSAAPQTGTQDWSFRDVKTILDTGDLHRSALMGALSHLKSSGFSFLNGAFEYGTGGTALTIGGSEIPTSGIAPAVVVYSATGEVI